MEKIKNRLKITDSIIPETYWDITRSGKVLELHIRPSIDSQPEEYRLGTIQIGRVISLIQSMAVESDVVPQIQLFPNLAENQLAATIYWPDLLTENVKKPPISPSQKQRFTETDLNRMSSHYNLFAEKKSVSDEDTMIRYEVLSRSNQPFIWLKVGQFIQELKEHQDIDSPIQSHVKILRPVKTQTQKDNVPIYPQLEIKISKSA